MIAKAQLTVLDDDGDLAPSEDFMPMEISDVYHLQETAPVTLERS